MPQFIDLTSRRFGRLTVLQRDRTEDTKRVWWLCVCDCGQQATIRGDALTCGRTLSCGCYLHERLVELGRTKTLTHGHARRGRWTKTYRAWINMLSRCTNPNSEDWQYYGAQGVEVRFPNYEAFLAHAGEAPPNKSIDRWPDKNGHYEPGNVRWATPKEQAGNKRRYKRSLTLEQADAIRADPRSMQTIAAECGVSTATIYAIKHGLHCRSSS